MDQVKPKTLAEGIARSLRRMRTDNACPVLHNAARLTRPFSTAPLSRRDSEGYTIKSPARKTLRDLTTIVETREAEVTNSGLNEPTNSVAPTEGL